MVPPNLPAHFSRVFSVAFALAVASCGPSPKVLPPSPPDPAGPLVVGSAPVVDGQAIDPKSPPTLDEAKRFLADTDVALRRVWSQEQRAGWINATFITDDTDALSADASESSMAVIGQKIKEARRYDGLLGMPADMARQFKLLKLGAVLPAPGDPKERAELAKLAVDMQSEYGKGKYCSAKLKKYASKDSKDGCLTLGDLSKVLEKSRDFAELTEAWTGWRTVSVPMRKQFERYVELGNKGAKEIGFKDVGELWKSGYDMSPAEFEADIERLWTQVKPLYDDLHCYARAKLRKQYGKDKIPEGGPIPANVLGNMWAQQWGSIYPLLAPYPGEAPIDVTAGIKKQKWDSKKMVRVGEDFFVSLGMQKLPDSFWERSLFEKPRDREVVCHASAWDLTFAGDVRIKMCTEPNEEDLITIHHELGHDYYFLQYKDQPTLFENGANDGFHEGIGDTLALSVTPAYLKKLGLIDALPKNDNAEMNVLMRRALDKVAFLPFGKLIDQWRWDVFSGKTSPAQYNKAWYDLILKYQGIVPPVARTEAEFDPGSKYHVPANTPYMRYFLAAIYQFQFHRALCKAAGYTGPLSKCSIYGSKEAGAKLQAMLKMGASQPWPEAMRAISGETKADATAILEYFEPLDKWLKEQNKGEKCGW